MNIDIIEYFQQWYISKCNGTWEHSYGLDISTIDNPGWKVNINGESDRPLLSINLTGDDNNWIIINADDNEFKGYCSPQNLSVVLNHAKEWINSQH